MTHVQEDFELEWTAERARRSQRIRLAQCVLAGLACAAVTVAVPCLWLEASIVALMSGILAFGYAGRAREVWRELPGMAAGALRLRGSRLVGDDGSERSVTRAVSWPHRLVLTVGHDTIPVPIRRRRQAGLVRHLEASGLGVEQERGDLWLLILAPALLVGVILFVGAGAVVEGLAMVAVLWLGATSPAALVALIVLGGGGMLVHAGVRWRRAWVLRRNERSQEGVTPVAPAPPSPGTRRGPPPGRG